jgi:hypothetical protein
MTKKKSNTNADWGKAIDNIFEQNHKEDIMLNPSKLQMKYLTGYAKNIYDYAQLMNNVSEMAHQKLISFELAQKIMDVQSKNIKKDVKYLLSYIENDEEQTF